MQCVSHGYMVHVISHWVCVYVCLHHSFLIICRWESARRSFQRRWAWQIETLVMWNDRYSLSLSIGYSPIGSNRISLSFSLCIHIGFGIIPVLLIELNRFNSERLFSTRSCLYCVCLESTTIISTVYTVSWMCCVHLWNRLSGYHDGWPIDYSNLDASESAQHDSLSSVQTLVVRRA